MIKQTKRQEKVYQNLILLLKNFELAYNLSPKLSKKEVKELKKLSLKIFEQS
jgi:hypothetical protein